LPERLLGLLVLVRLQPGHLRHASTHRAGALVEREVVRAVPGERLVEPALADAAAVDVQRQHPLPLPVVPLRLAGHDGVAGQVSVRVVVLVTLLRLPTEQPPLRDAEAFGKF
jgi:hypothetical protein